MNGAHAIKVVGKAKFLEGRQKFGIRWGCYGLWEPFGRCLLTQTQFFFRCEWEMAFDVGYLVEKCPLPRLTIDHNYTDDLFLSAYPSRIFAALFVAGFDFSIDTRV